MADAKKWDTAKNNIDSAPGAIDWTPFIDDESYNTAIFGGEFLTSSGHWEGGNLTKRPGFADAPPAAPYHARVEVKLEGNFRDNDYHRDEELPRAFGLGLDAPHALIGHMESFTEGALPGIAPWRVKFETDVFIWGDERRQMARRITEFKDSFVEDIKEYNSPSRRQYRDREAEKKSRAEIKANADYHKRFPVFMDETFINNTLRHVFVQSVDEARNCARYYDSNGQLHRAGGEPALVLRHFEGELLEFYENGKPHCLTGPWRRGRDESILRTGRDSAPVASASVKPEYAIRGEILDKMAFDQHPEVIAARATETTLTRLGTWFGNAVNGYQDDGADLAALRRFDPSAQIGSYLSALDVDIRREVIGKMANLYHDQPGAKQLQQARLKEHTALSVRSNAAGQLLDASAQVDVIARDIARTRDQLVALELGTVGDALDVMIADVVEIKSGYTDALKRADALTNNSKAFNLKVGQAFDEAYDIINHRHVSGISPTDDMVVRELIRQHAELPDPNEETASFEEARGQMTKAADAAIAGMPGQMQKIMDAASVAQRFLDTKYDLGTGFKAVEDIGLKAHGGRRTAGAKSAI